MAQASKPSSGFARYAAYLPAMVFGVISSLVYADCLFDATRLPAGPTTDLAIQFLPWRDFGFGEILRGNLPLWNPHIYSGTPYMASFQSALFYPLNWLHLFLPLGLAISWYCAIHTFLMGYFTSLWVRSRGVGIWGQILAGVMMMLGGQYYLRVYAGHLPHLAVMVWVPLMLWSVDRLAEGGSWRWVLLGVWAAAMQVLAGHPQYVFYTGIVLAMYVPLRSVFSGHRRRLVVGVAAIGVGALVLSAIQWLPGVLAARENVRIGGLPYEMAAEFSAGAEQWLTLVAPYMWGDMRPAAEGSVELAYVGHGYLWELCFFMSITGLVLAMAGLLHTTRWNRLTSIAIIVVLVTISTGRFLPVHHWVYDVVPFFSSFRAPSKFMFFVALLLAMLAGEGFETMRRGDVKLKRLGIAAACGAAVVLAVAIVLYAGGESGGLWTWTMTRMASLPDRFNPRVFEVAGIGRLLWQIAAASLLAAAGTLAAMAVVLFATIRRQGAIAFLVVLAMAELGVFAWVGRGTMPSAVAYPAEWAAAMQDNPQQYRCLHAQGNVQNAAMSLGTYDMWGYDPGVLRRYGQLIAASQGVDPDKATQYVHFTNVRDVENLYRMFRLRWGFSRDREPAILPAPLPRAVLVGAAETLPSREAMFARLLDKSFDPASVVYLGNRPSIPAAGGTGQVKVTDINTDTMEVEVDASAPAICLITDNFAEGWRVRAMPGSSQQQYELMPANYTLRGIPLAAGRHHFRIEYVPPGWVAGVWISVVGIVGYAAVGVVAWRKRSQEIR